MYVWNTQNTDKKTIWQSAQIWKNYFWNTSDTHRFYSLSVTRPQITRYNYDTVTLRLSKDVYIILHYRIWYHSYHDMSFWPTLSHKWKGKDISSSIWYISYISWNSFPRNSNAWNQYTLYLYRIFRNTSMSTRKAHYRERKKIWSESYKNTCLKNTKKNNSSELFFLVFFKVQSSPLLDHKNQVVLFLFLRLYIL